MRKEQSAASRVLYTETQEETAMSEPAQMADEAADLQSIQVLIAHEMLIGSRTESPVGAPPGGSCVLSRGQEETPDETRSNDRA